MDNYWTELFMAALVAGFVLSARFRVQKHTKQSIISYLNDYKESCEFQTMACLTLVWYCGFLINEASPVKIDYLSFAFVDIWALVWLWFHQKRNWQHIEAFLFVCMLLMYLIYAVGIMSGVIIEARRPFLDIITFFAYLQILTVILAASIRGGRHRVIWSKGITRTALSNNRVFAWSVYRKKDEGQKRWTKNQA